MRVADTARVPPGGYFRFKVPETGHSFSHPYFQQLERIVKAHRKANHLPIGSDWEAQFHDGVCQATPTCPCVPADPLERTLWKRAQQFFGAMKNWAAQGFPLVDQPTLLTRRAICEGGLDSAGIEHPTCSHWQQSSHYFGFGRCGKCGCVGGLKTPIATEHCPLHLW